MNIYYRMKIYTGGKYRSERIHKVLIVTFETTKKEILF